MLGVLFTLIAFAIFVFVLLWKYNRSKMRYIYYRMVSALPSYFLNFEQWGFFSSVLFFSPILLLYCILQKYFICCCRLSDEDIRRQNEEDDTPLFDTLNDLLFGINENDEVGRVNISALTNDYEDGESAPLPLEVSVESFFPDLLAGLDSNINKTSQNDESNDNNLREALLNNDNRSRDEG